MNGKNLIMWSIIKQFIIGCLIVSGNALQGQNAPVTIAGTVNNAVPGQNIIVPITATGFNNIGSVTLTLDYDYQKLHFVSCTKNPLLSGTFNVGDNDLGNGIHRLILGWYGPATTLPEGSSIVNYEFFYVFGNASLEWIDIGPSCEYTDANANILNDFPTSTYYINGWICTPVSIPGPIAGSDTVCQGQTGVEYSIDPLLQVTGYHWSVPAGSTIVSGFNTNAITVDFPASSVSGNIEVNGVNECGNGPVSTLPVTIHNPPVKPQIILSGMTLISSASSGNQWYKDMEIIPGATDQTYTPEENGKYYDVVTENGCSSDSSNNIDVTVINIEENSLPSFRIFPNPAEDVVFIKSSGPPVKPEEVLLFSSYGRFLRKFEITGGPFLDDFKVDVGNIKPGAYFLRIQTEKGIFVHELVIL